MLYVLLPLGIKGKKVEDGLRKKEEKVSKDIKVSKVQIKIGEKRIVLSLEDAMSLKKILNETFPDKVIEFHQYPAPVVIPQPYRRWDDWRVHWTTSASSYTYTDSSPETLYLSRQE